MSRFFSNKYLKYRAAAQGQLIEDDRPCAQCGYNVRGLRIGGRCPECGASIVLPDAARDALSDAPLYDIRTLQGGFRLGMVCLVGLVLCPLAGVLGTVSPVLAAGGMLAGSVLWVAAAWLMTPPLEAPGGVRRGFGRSSRLRLAARHLQLAWPAGVLVAPGVTPLPITLGVAVIAVTVLALTGLAGLMVMAVLMRRLAEWCYNDFADNLLGWAVLGFPLCVAGLLVTVWVSPLLACGFLVLWLAALGAFALAMVSLGRSVSWSVRHALERAERDREMRDRIAAARGEGWA